LTNKPKKQSFRNYFLVFSCFTILLVGLFVYATSYQTTFFIFLGLSLLLSILLLVSFHRRLVQKQSQINIQKEEYFEKANLMKAELNKEWRAIESFRRKIINYSQLKDLTEKLGMSLTLAETSQTLSGEVSHFFGHKDITVILYLFHSQTGELGISSSQKGQMQVNIKSKNGDIFDQHVVKTLQPLLIEDTKKDFRFDIERNLPEDSRAIRSLISGPLLIGQKALGILRVDSAEPDHFVQEDLRFLLTIVNLASVAIENAQLYERIEDMAIRDSLTGLFLRRHMLARLDEELKREMRSHKPMSFLMLDIDYFKKYNDSFGHIAGDIVLKTLAKRLTSFFNEPGNIICRYGGEEFCVILPDCDKQKAELLSNEFRVLIEKEVIVLRRQNTSITVSIGVASFPDDAQMKEEVIYKADHALYRAKEQGRNRVCTA
jgi:diguanylate cyclase (GGDEF)-like protein